MRVGFRVDQITFVMLAAVTFVGMLVQIYSTGYMAHTDEQGHKHYEVRYSWYYAVLSLFIAAMLTLVLADNFLLLYIAWEGVGVCSFLLIGHYFERRSAAEASKKAFITTRFGDVFLLIGIIMLWREAGTFDMTTIFHMAEEGEFNSTYLSVATLFLFGGAMGKSAQFPFHVWLPDAMEGPTPVSALIHAATMVVAGVYLVARAMPLFEASEAYVLDFVIVIGLITTFMSVGMGMVMTDIKRVVAYSTLNSLGLMMVALGFGEHGVGAAMLYLFAHAFFKALLFLGCGSVIHATDNQEVSKLGGLADKLPITSKTFLIGSMAMAGVVPLAGFFAKDEILVAAKDASPVTLILLLLTLPFTAHVHGAALHSDLQGRAQGPPRARARARVRPRHVRAAYPASHPGGGLPASWCSTPSARRSASATASSRWSIARSRSTARVPLRRADGDHLDRPRARRPGRGDVLLGWRRRACRGDAAALPVHPSRAGQQVLRRRLLPVGD